MNEEIKKQDAHRLGFMIPLVLFVLFFVMCCGVLSCVFLWASEKTVHAGQYNDCVQICRNQAERLQSPGTPLLGESCELYFDADYSECPPEQAVYRLKITETLQPAASGNLRMDTLEAFAEDTSPVYTLDVATYLPEGR